MKKKTLIAAFWIIMILSGFIMGSRIYANVRKDNGASKGASDTADKFTGTWYLSGDNDYSLIDGTFPDVYAFGDELVIRPDGKIYWHIGAAGAAGTYEVYGNQLTAVVSDIMEYDEYRIALTLNDDGSLNMKYKSTDLEWVYGAGSY